jgi:hypothetical protein
MVSLCGLLAAKVPQSCCPQKKAFADVKGRPSRFRSHSLAREDAARAVKSAWGLCRRHKRARPQFAWKESLSD